MPQKYAPFVAYKADRRGGGRAAQHRRFFYLRMLPDQEYHYYYEALCALALSRFTDSAFSISCLEPNLLLVDL
jgi:hypothetical protein